jgi:hypothetical protein
VSGRTSRCAAIAFAACGALLLGTARSHAAAPRAPDSLAPLARSFSHPIRVVGRTPGHAADAIQLLADAERAYDAVTLGLGMPEPDVDPLTARITVTLDDAPTEPLVVRLVREPLYAYDRAFAQIDLAATWAPGCARDHALTQGFARAALARLSPTIDERDARAISGALADLATPCAAPPPPQPTARSLARDATGTRAFWEDLDATYGADPGRLLAAMAALSATKTQGNLPPDSRDAAAPLPSPDIYAVLRHSFADALVKTSTFDDVLLDLAVRRVFAHGGADVATDWRIDWPTAPRRLALTGLEPCGASYSVIDLPAAAGGDAGAPQPRLRFEATWEQHATFRFALLALAPDGHLLRRLDSPPMYKADSAALTLVDLDGAATIVVVATNTGDPDLSLSLPLDGAEPLEPHVALITLAAE